MRHERKVALICLYNVGSLQIVLIETVDDLVKSSYILIVGCEINVASFAAVAIGVKGVCTSILLVYKHAKILRPISKRCRSIDESIGSGDVVGNGKTLE